MVKNNQTLTTYLVLAFVPTWLAWLGLNFAGGHRPRHHQCGSRHSAAAGGDPDHLEKPEGPLTGGSQFPQLSKRIGKHPKPQDIPSRLCSFQGAREKIFSAEIEEMQDICTKVC